MTDESKTGDDPGIRAALTLASGAGLARLALEARKRRTNAL